MLNVTDFRGALSGRFFGAICKLLASRKTPVGLVGRWWQQLAWIFFLSHGTSEPHAAAASRCESSRMGPPAPPPPLRRWSPGLSAGADRVKREECPGGEHEVEDLEELVCAAGGQPSKQGVLCSGLRGAARAAAGRRRRRRTMVGTSICVQGASMLACKILVVSDGLAPAPGHPRRRPPS